jgi:immune inhibitor A
VHSGYGEEDSTTMLNRTNYGEAAVWSHSSQVTPPYSVTQDVAASAYIMMPENGGIGVFAHEYGHNLGADDLYAYGDGETSAGFWTLMADDWTGHPIGFEPPAVDPWHLDNWGWLNPAVITDTTQVYTITLGQASRFPGGAGVYRGAKIMLPDQIALLPVQPMGNYGWWGGKADLANSSMTTKNPIAVPAGATLSFDMAYDIEDYWDFLWVQVSADGGTSWDTLTNTHTTCSHVAGWIGDLYGMDGECGFTSYNASFPNYETETFDLGAYAGQNVLLRLWYMTDWGTTYTGPFVDNVAVTGVFSDDAEAGGDNWDYVDDWIHTDGSQSFTHNYYLQWRNVGDNGGYDSALGDPRWRYGPANTGLLVWYNNNSHTDNEIFNYLTTYPGFGPKGRMLVVDSHPEPYREPGMVAAGYDNEGANVRHRSLMRDAPFTLQDTVAFTMTNSHYPYTSTEFTTAFPGRPAVSEFDDGLSYYPGAEYASRGPSYSPPSYKWLTKQWDASVVLPSTNFYGIKAPGYIGTGADRAMAWATMAAAANHVTSTASTAGTSA